MPGEASVKVGGKRMNDEYRQEREREREEGERALDGAVIK